MKNQSKQKRNSKNLNRKKLQKQNKQKRKNNKLLGLSLMTLKENSKTVKINSKFFKIFWQTLIKKKSVFGKFIMIKIHHKEKFFIWLKILQMEVSKESKISENQHLVLGVFMENKEITKFVESWFGKELKFTLYGKTTHHSNIINLQNLIHKMKTIDNWLLTTLWRQNQQKDLLFNLLKESYELLYYQTIFFRFSF